jgi:hypothetical protein
MDSKKRGRPIAGRRSRKPGFFQQRDKRMTQGPIVIDYQYALLHLHAEASYAELERWSTQRYIPQNAAQGKKESQSTVCRHPRRIQKPV